MLYQSRLYALRGKNAARLFDLFTFYSGVDWEGIHTCMLTCVTSLTQMSVRRTRRWCCVLAGLLRRDSGAVIHATGHALAGHIVELLFVLAPIFLLGAWIATALNALLISAHRWWSPSRSPARKRFWPGVRPGGNSRSRHGIIIGTVVSAVIYTFVWPESERAHCRKNWLARWVC